MTELESRSERALQELVEQLRTRNAQLEHALKSRILIEQAKGVLAERYGLTMDAAFDVLRGSARSNRLQLHSLAARVVDEETTPVEVALTLAKPIAGVSSARRRRGTAASSPQFARAPTSP
jgi:hypothetical protein